MDLISTLLGKFRKLYPPEAVVRNATLESLQSLNGFELNPSAIKIQHGVIFIDANPLIKSELMLYKKELLARVNAKLAPFNRVVKDVR